MSNREPKPSVVLPVMPSADVAESLNFCTSTLGFTELFRQPDKASALANAQATFAGG